MTAQQGRKRQLFTHRKSVVHARICWWLCIWILVRKAWRLSCPDCFPARASATWWKAKQQRQQRSSWKRSISGHPVLPRSWTKSTNFSVRFRHNSSNFPSKIIKIRATPHDCENFVPVLASGARFRRKTFDMDTPMNVKLTLHSPPWNSMWLTSYTENVDLERNSRDSVKRKCTPEISLCCSRELKSYLCCRKRTVSCNRRKYRLLGFLSYKMKPRLSDQAALGLWLEQRPNRTPEENSAVQHSQKSDISLSQLAEFVFVVYFWVFFIYVIKKLSFSCILFSSPCVLKSMTMNF